jgi:Acetyltransferase (GNAT) domain
MGYSTREYAQAFREFGQPLNLPRCRGWILERQIPGTDAVDAMGCYPLFACQDWHRLWEDLESLENTLVSLTLVTDPFADAGPDELREAFPTLMRPYKEHFVTELGPSPESFVDPHHLRNARKALSRVRIEFAGPTDRLLQSWVRMYRILQARHQIRGMGAFSKLTFEHQFAVPGLVIQWAEAAGVPVGMVLWLIMGDRVYYHLGAYEEVGYELKCSFALFRSALDYFAGIGVRWIVLGAGAGAQNDGTDGLSRFKRGWANGTRTVYLCGRILDPNRYTSLCRGQEFASSEYFPIYRKGEFR